jgi:hypothetical protein
MDVSGRTRRTLVYPGDGLRGCGGDRGDGQEADLSATTFTLKVALTSGASLAVTA